MTAGLGAALFTGGAAPSDLFKMPDITGLLSGLSGFGGGTTVKTNQSSSTSLSNSISFALNTISGGGTTGAATSTPTSTSTPTVSASEPLQSSVIPSYSIDPGGATGTAVAASGLPGFSGNISLPLMALGAVGLVAYLVFGRKK